jgi:apolipoprotein D and lipocalin family protein
VAKFRGDEDVGSLKVTFFWPFYGGYHIIVLDKEEYAYSMVAGPSRSYLWILAREPELDQDILDDLVSKAEAWGFATHELIYVDQSMAEK